MKSLFACLSLAVVIGCQSTSEATETAPPAAPTASAQSLSDLLRDYVASTGNQLTYDEETGNWLDSIPVESVGPAELRLLRLGPIPEAVAQGEDLHLEIVALQHADANATATALDDLARDAIGEGSSQIRIVADERTNSLLIWADAENLERVKTLASHLDVDDEI